MKKTMKELVYERMKARTFIRQYYAASGSMPTVQQVSAARTLTADDIAFLQNSVQADALIAQSEGREPVVLGESMPKAGMNGAVIGIIDNVEFDNGEPEAY